MNGRAITPDMKKAILADLLDLWLAFPTERLGQLLLNSMPDDERVSPGAFRNSDEILANIERRMFNVEDIELLGLIEARLARGKK